MTFRVGQEVVCVNGDYSDGWNRDGCLNRPVRGGIYTVRSVTTFLFTGEPEPCLALLLEEIKNPVRCWSRNDPTEIPFWADRFRPIVERKTDISIFKRMLTPQGIDA